MGLYSKMLLVMGEVGQMYKDGDIHDRQGKKMYSYLSEEQTTGELQKAFIKIGLVMFPVEVTDEIEYIEGIQYDKPFRNAVTKVKVKYKIVDPETGEFDFIQSIGYGSDSADKGSNKAMTGAYKYAERQSFMISTGDDGDHEPSEPQKPVQPKQQAPTTPPPSKSKGTEKPTTPPIGHHADLLQKSKEVFQQIKGSLDGFDAYNDTKLKNGNSQEAILDGLIKLLLKQEKENANAPVG